MNICFNFWKSYCHQCLEEIKQNSTIVCPTCRQETRLPQPDDVTSLRVNFTIQNLIGVLSERATFVKGGACGGGEGGRGGEKAAGDDVRGGAADDIWCGNCEGKPAAATCGCIDCNDSFCDECNTAVHGVVKKFKTHKVVPIGEYAVLLQVAKKAEAAAKLAKCRKHPENDLKFCCNQVRCIKLF